MRPLITPSRSRAGEDPVGVRDLLLRVSEEDTMERGEDNPRSVRPSRVTGRDNLTAGVPLAAAPAGRAHK